MNLLDALSEIVGASNILTGTEAERYGRDWTGKYTSAPCCVVRPGSTAEVSALVRACGSAKVPIVPISGNTGLTGGGHAEDSVMVSLERMNRIEEIRKDARIAIVEAGVVLSQLHDAVADDNLLFPLTFGARGSAMIGGCLSTNAGGSNVVRYGSTRGLCLGLEAVLPDGRVLDQMSALHKDNSGYDLRDLLIGAEGTLGIITRAVLKLTPKPRAYATAMVATPSLQDGLKLLNHLQEATGGAVEAFEYMPDSYIARHLERIDGARPPFDERHEVNIMVEVGATAFRDATPSPDGGIPVVRQLEEILGHLLEDGVVLDAVVAQSEAQRREMWARREEAAEITLITPNLVDTDICVPVDKVGDFLDRMKQDVRRLDPEAKDLVVSHLGDGNLHYTVYPSHDDPVLRDEIRARIDFVADELGGSFSAEHGIGLTKLPSMERLKDPVAIDVMRAIKMALDPNNLMNPGKVVPIRRAAE